MNLSDQKKQKAARDAAKAAHELRMDRKKNEVRHRTPLMFVSKKARSKAKGETYRSGLGS